MDGIINIDFQTIVTHDPKTLVIADISSWGHIKNKPAIIEITTPGFTKPITHYLDKNKINLFNSLNLGLHCNDCNPNELADLPDGIYKITVKGSPSTFNLTREYLKTDLIQLEIDKIFTKLNITELGGGTPQIEKIMKLNLYMKAAESFVRVGDHCTAQELLFKIQKDINKLKNCKTCV